MSNLKDQLAYNAFQLAQQQQQLALEYQSLLAQQQNISPYKCLGDLGINLQNCGGSALVQTKERIPIQFSAIDKDYEDALNELNDEFPGLRKWGGQ